MVFLILIISSIFFSIEISAAVYEVQPNEHLSAIAYKYCRKVYGKIGFISEIKKINPHLHSNLNFLLTKTVIRIPDQSVCLLPWPETNQTIQLPKSSELMEKNNEIEPIKNSPRDHFFLDFYTFYKRLGSSSIADSSSDTFRRIQGVKLISKPAVGFNLGYQYPINDQTSHYLLIGFHTEDYYSSNNVKINSNSNIRTSFNFGINHHFLNGQMIKIQAGVQERTFIDKSSYSQINLDKAIIPNLQSSFGHKFHDNGKRKAYLLGFAGYLFPSQMTNINIKQGYELGTGLRYHSLLFRRHSTISMDISRLEQSTSVTLQTEWRGNVNWQIDISPL